MPHLRFPRSFLLLSQGFWTKRLVPLDRQRPSAGFLLAAFERGAGSPQRAWHRAPHTSGAAAWAHPSFPAGTTLGRTRPGVPGHLFLCTLGGAGGPGPAGRGAMSYFRAVAPPGNDRPSWPVSPLPHQPPPIVSSLCLRVICRLASVTSASLSPWGPQVCGNPSPTRTGGVVCELRTR